MLIFPAIDLKDGQVVRLVKGDFGTVRQVAQDPESTARTFYEDGGGSFVENGAGDFGEACILPLSQHG